MRVCVWHLFIYARGHNDIVGMAKKPSPWLSMPGFDMRLCWFDPMHTVFLGTARDLIPSCIGHWFRFGLLGPGVLAEHLRVLSVRVKDECRNAGFNVMLRAFTPANTGLDKPSEFPELSTVYKAATVKSLIWFFARMAVRIADQNSDSTLFSANFCSSSTSAALCRFVFRTKPDR